MQEGEEDRECGRLGSAGRVIVKWDLLYAARNFNFVFISFSCFRTKFVCANRFMDH